MLLRSSLPSLGCALAAIALGAGCRYPAPTPIPPGKPSISNLNGSTAAASPTGVALEVNGESLGSPGVVRFTQDGSPPVDVSPDPSAWRSDSVLVTVPTTLTAPGTAAVQVVSSGGTSAAVNLTLVVTSPLLTAGNNPRFLLIGGELVSSPGTLSAVVARTEAP